VRLVLADQDARARSRMLIGHGAIVARGERVVTKP
jgi:hypothetical protein